MPRGLSASLPDLDSESWIEVKKRPRPSPARPKVSPEKVTPSFFSFTPNGAERGPRRRLSAWFICGLAGNIPSFFAILSRHLTAILIFAPPPPPTRSLDRALTQAPSSQQQREKDNAGRLPLPQSGSSSSPAVPGNKVKKMSSGFSLASPSRLAAVSSDAALQTLGERRAG